MGFTKRDAGFGGSISAENDLLVGGQPQPMVVTIGGAEQVQFDGEAPKVKLNFTDCDKGLVLNQTNWNSIEEITGQFDTDSWKGHQIELFPTKVQFGARMVWAVRVRRPSAAAPAPATAAPPAQSPPMQPTQTAAPVAGTLGPDAMRDIAMRIGQSSGGTLPALREYVEKNMGVTMPVDIGDWPATARPFIDNYLLTLDMSTPESVGGAPT